MHSLRRLRPQQLGALRRVLRRDAVTLAKGVAITMPALSPTMATGKIARWSKAEGDKLGSGDVLAEIETDKATVDFQFQDDDFFLARILLPAGTEANVGVPLAVVVDDVKDIKAAYDAAAVLLPGAAGAAAAPAAPPAGAGGVPAAAAAAAAAPAPPAASGGAAAFVMPAARALLARNNVAEGAVAGTGKGGRVTKGDVLAHLGHIPAARGAVAAPPPAASPAAAAPAVASAAAAAPARAGGTFTDTKPSTMRKVIAQRLGVSKATVPHAYASTEVCLDALLALRTALKAGGVAVSVNDVVIAAAAKALRAVPAANAFWDAKAEAVVPCAGVDVSIAVATDGGLITPIVKGADTLGLAGIAAAVKDLAARARAGKLAPAEFQGGSFTISNLGMFGSISEFSAVINAPQACILAVGKGEQRVALSRGGAAFDPDVHTLDAAADAAAARIATMMTVQLSADARVVDDADAARFLAAFRGFVETPSSMLA